MLAERSAMTSDTMILIILLALLACASATNDQDWTVSTILTANEVIPTGGVAIDPAESATGYVSDKTNGVIWVLNMTTGGDAVMLTGQQGGPKRVRDGPRGTATFAQPRGLCVESTTGNIIVVDGPSSEGPALGYGAVLRTVAVSGPAAGYVTTVLGSPSHFDGARDGSGKSAILSSGSWLLVCLPGGSALLVDANARSVRHICPPGWKGQCGVLDPAAPAAAPTGKQGPSWCAVATYIAVGCLIGGAAVAGYSAAVGYVSGKISALRAKHQGTARPRYGDDGAAGYMALPHHTPSPAKQRWLGAMWAAKQPSQTAAAFGAEPAQLESRASDAEHSQTAAAGSGAHEQPCSRSAIWRLAAGPVEKWGVSPGVAAAGCAASAAAGESAASGSGLGHQTFPCSAQSNVTDHSDPVHSAAGPGSHVTTIAYQPLATGSSSTAITADASMISSEDASSTSWEAGASHRALGRATLSAPTGAAGAAGHVHQRPTGQSLTVFSDVDSFI